MFATSVRFLVVVDNTLGGNSLGPELGGAGQKRPPF